MKRKIKFILLIVFMICTTAVFSSQELTTKETYELKDLANPLQGVDPKIPDDSDLAALDKVIGNAKVVGLGEGTHGTHEFFQMKHRMVQYLVQKKGFTIFAIEGSMPQADLLNDYILNGKGNPQKLIAGMGYWTWYTNEVLAMIEWMGEYNQTAEKKIKFVGFDMVLPPNTYEKNITDPMIEAGKEDESEVVNQIITDVGPVTQKTQEYYSERSKTEALEENAYKNYSQLLSALKTKHLPDAVFNMEATALKLNFNKEIQKIQDQFNQLAKSIKDEDTILVQSLNTRIDALVNDVVSNKNFFVSKIGCDKYEVMLENIQLIKEYLQLEAALENSDRTRDKLMAKNILWIVQQNPNDKFILWAHNGHIVHSDMIYPRMGKYLQNALADNYRAIGFLTSEGKYTAVSANDPTKLGAYDLQTPPDNAMESIIEKLNMPLVLLNFSDKNTLPAFLYNPVLSRYRWGIGAEEVPQEFQFNSESSESYSDYLGLNFDSLIYIKTTTASQLLSTSYSVRNFTSVDNPKSIGKIKQ
ncbi:MAG: erythromycin esterase family protein [Gammaproteobacteria bacterium]